jgi:peptidyl-prolyl cis-trans isomerase D
MKSKINKFFAWIIVLLLVLGLAGFGLQDVLSRWGTSKLATVGEVEISTEEFGQSFIREINYISQNIGKNLTIEEAKSFGLHFQVVERLINRSLLDQLLIDLKISVGDVLLLKNLKTNPNFKNAEGNFDRKKYNDYLSKINLSENEFEKILRNDLSRELFTQILDPNFNHNQNIVKTIADHIGEERKVKLYKLNYDTNTSLQDFNKDEVRKFYENNKNNYSSKSIRKYSVLNINPSQFLNEIEITEEEIQNIYEERKQNFTQPEFRELSRIIFQTSDLANEALNKILSNEKTFEEIGKDLDLNKKEINFGTYSKKDLDDELSDFIFDAKIKKNSIVGPINGELGFELYKVNKIIPEFVLGEEKAKSQIINEIQLENSLNKLSEMIPEVEDMIASGETLEEIARKYQMNIENIEISKGDELPKKYRNKNLKTYFDEASNDNTDLLQIEDNTFISIRLDDEIEPIIPSFEKIYDQLLDDYKISQILELMEKDLNEVITKYTLDEAVKLNKIIHLFDDKINRETNDSFKILNKLTVENIFQNSVGDFVIQKMNENKNPYLILIETTKIIPASSKSTYDKVLKNIQNQVNEQVKNDLITSLLNSLRQTYEPKVNYELLNQIIDNIQ